MPFVQKYTDQALVDEVRRVVAGLPSGPVSEVAFRRHSMISVATLRRRFGDWSDVLAAAGHGDRYEGGPVSARMRDQPTKSMTDEEIFAELRRVAAVTGSRQICQSDVRAHSALLGGMVLRYRFGSFRAGVKAARLEVSRMGNRWTDQDCFDNLRVLFDHYGRAPTAGELAKPPSQITPDTYRHRFGSIEAAVRTYLEHAEP